MDVTRIIQEGFKIVDGRLYDRACTTYGVVRVEEFGWGSPCREYHFNDYDFHEYSIVQDSYDDWYLVKDGYIKICRLNYYGGKNWST